MAFEIIEDIEFLNSNVSEYLLASLLLDIDLILKIFEDAGKLHKYLRTCILGYSSLLLKNILPTIAMANSYLQFDAFFSLTRNSNSRIDSYILSRAADLFYSSYLNQPYYSLVVCSTNY